VLDDPTNTRSTSNQVLAQFGLSLDLRVQQAPVGIADPLQLLIWNSGGRVVGGESLIQGTDSTSICSIVRQGKGQVIAFANSHLFERKTMGYTAMIPNPTQNAISQLEYKLMSYLNYPPVHAESGSSSTETTE
jgi:hypothetical protein